MIRPVDFLLLLMMALAGLLTASWAGARHGWIGSAVGLLLGVAALLGILYAAALTWVLVEGLFLTGIPWLPTCRKERCKGGLLTDFGDYNLVPIGGDRWGFRCRCGDTYQKTGRQFVEIGPDGTVRPYLVWRPLKGWRLDQEPSDP